MRPPTYRTMLTEKKKIARDLLELRFEKPSGFSFTAGQFAQFHIPEGGRIALRSYSISSAPHDPFLEFCVKLLPDGKASAHFEKMNGGEEMTLQGPSGRFTMEKNSNGSYFIATGAGLAPIMAMMRDATKNRANGREMRLLFGVRSEEDLFWVDRLEKLKHTHEMFAYDVTLSQPKPNGGWRGLRGRVTDHILRHLIKHHFYLCGNAAMVKDVREMLLQNGTPTERIRFEIF